MNNIDRRLFEHMAWANQKVFASVAELPDEALSAFLVNADWSTGRILQHIVEGAEWYVVCMDGHDEQPIKFPKTMTDIQDLALELSRLDALLLLEIGKPDARLDWKFGEEVIDSMRSTVLAQVVHHATEHRAQLVAALEFRGYQTINLDDIDLWHFESQVG
jgi:uncharacterized damage-inducible protein DinB